MKKFFCTLIILSFSVNAQAQQNNAAKNEYLDKFSKCEKYEFDSAGNKTTIIGWTTEGKCKYKMQNAQMQSDCEMVKDDLQKYIETIRSEKLFESMPLINKSCITSINGMISRPTRDEDRKADIITSVESSGDAKEKQIVDGFFSQYQSNLETCKRYNAVLNRPEGSQKFSILGLNNKQECEIEITLSAMDTTHTNLCTYNLEQLKQKVQAYKTGNSDLIDDKCKVINK